MEKANACRIRCMRKLLPLLLCILFLLSSCASSGQSSHYTDEQKKEALLLLGNDMIAAGVAEGPLTADEFIALLPPSFTAYQGYSPIYDDLAASYCGKVAEIVTPAVEAALPLLRTSFEAAASADINQAIAAPEGMTDSLQNVAARPVYTAILSGIMAREDSLEEAFAEAYGIFSSVRDAYLNLASVGVDTALPVPEPFAPEMLAIAAESALFTRLGEAERSLKGMLPESPDSLYAVFWEGAFESV